MSNPSDIDKAFLTYLESLLRSRPNLIEYIQDTINRVNDGQVDSNTSGDEENSGKRLNVVLLDGLKIRKIRKNLKMTQLQLGAMSEISNGYISMIELHSSTRVSKSTARKIAQALGRDLSQILF